MAQVRMFGGSIGIAASTAILGMKQRHQLLDSGLVSPTQLESLQDSMAQFSLKQIHGVRQAYTDSFNESLVVCSVIAAVSVLVTVGCWQKNPMDLLERRDQQFENEAKRQQALAEAKGQAAAINAAEARGELNV